LRTINRIVALNAGLIELDTTNILQRDVIELRREIGYVIQAGGLFPHYSVAENIAVVPQMLGWQRDTVAARVAELLQLVRLDPARYAERKPRELSGGEMQRVGVARALAARPRLILMDEPFGALDPLVRATLQQELIGEIKALGTTIIFVTHDVDEALSLADDVLVLEGGRVQQFGPPLEILQRPASPFVAEFMNAGDRIRQLRIIPLQALLKAGRGSELPTGEEVPRVALRASLYDAFNIFLTPLAPGGLPPAQIAVYDDDDNFAGTVELADIVTFAPAAA
jgi:osmoprotectant transport system ATP-binding protein